MTQRVYIFHKVCTGANIQIHISHDRSDLLTFHILVIVIRHILIYEDKGALIFLKSFKKIKKQNNAQPHYRRQCNLWYIDIYSI